jgi:acyl-CoA dehydrogenase
MDLAHLDWPFFDERHRALAREAHAWAASQRWEADEADVDAECRALVRRLGEAGWLHHAVAGTAGIDTRAVCLLREVLAWHHGLADFAFAMQGLGSGAISLAGTPTQRERWLPRVAGGEAIAAFALSEPEAGSDVAALACEARDDGDAYVLNGDKTWISNGGIADFYVLFARTGEAPGARGITAFIVEAGTPGLEIAERLQVMAPHPLARLRLTDCRVPVSQRLGEAGQGFKLAGHAHARRVSHFGGGRRAGLRPARVA